MSCHQYADDTQFYLSLDLLLDAAINALGRHHEELEPGSTPKGLSTDYIGSHQLPPVWRLHQVTLILTKAASRLT